LAEDKKADAGGDAGKTSKKRMNPLVLVAVGAAIGGAGVVAFLPKPAPVVHVDEGPKWEIVGYEPAMTLTFNPRVERGSAPIVRVTFRIDVKQDARKAADVRKAMTERRDRMKHRVLMVLRDQPLQIFTSGSDGTNILTKRLITELNAELFPTGLAQVDDIVYDDIYVRR
jgi:flagellar basal body-associated protein FliL